MFNCFPSIEIHKAIPVSHRCSLVIDMRSRYTGTHKFESAGYFSHSNTASAFLCFFRDPLDCIVTGFYALFRAY
nr:MAG TPA: hypothetical protein [Caudoviricetes sp.]